MSLVVLVWLVLSVAFCLVSVVRVVSVGVVNGVRGVSVGSVDAIAPVLHVCLAFIFLTFKINVMVEISMMEGNFYKI